MRVRRDPLYLFACHLEWRNRRNLEAHEELVAALDDHDRDIRELAELLLHRSSPRPEAESGNSLANSVASRRRFERVRQYSRTD
jgi:hypothetical protein